MYLRTSPTLEINEHQIPTSKGATLKLRPPPFIQPTPEAPDLLSIHVLTPPNITYFVIILWTPWTPGGFQLILLILMLWTPGVDSMDSIWTPSGMR